MVGIITSSIHLMVIIHHCIILHYLYTCCIKGTTVNGKRFAGLNFHVFHSFQEYRENFPVIWTSRFNHTKNEYFWPRQSKSISAKTSMRLKPWTFSPVNLSMSTVCVYSLLVHTSYFISCSINAWYFSVISIVCKWHWGYR